jgi:MFS family permease
VKPSERWIAPLCLAALLWAFSFGVNAALASFWMERAGCLKSVIGLNTGTYYLGIALAAAAVPALMRRWGWRALLLGMAASAVTAAAFPWGDGLPGWFALRLLNGGAAALSLIPLETCVNERSAPPRRAWNFGCYAFSIALGMALGMALGTEVGQEWMSAARLTFLLAGAAALLAGAVVLAWRPVFGPVAEEERGRTPVGLVRNFLSFGSAWSQGFLEGGMVALLPLYLASVGLSSEAVTALMAGLMVGVIVAQAPIAWLADRLGRGAVLVGCNAVTLLGIAALMLPLGHAWLAAWLFVVGACSGALYPLGLALLGERTAPGGLARANAWFLAINCVGSMVGPAAAGLAVDGFGYRAMFVAGGVAVGGVLVVRLALGRRCVAVARQPEPEEQSTMRAAA